MDFPGEDIVDIAGLDPGMHGTEATRPAAARPWVGIRFDCCGVYARIYRDADGRAYRGRCPRCLRETRLRVGPGGTSARFFRAE